jgi:hypothetical protein
MQKRWFIFLSFLFFLEGFVDSVFFEFETLIQKVCYHGDEATTLIHHLEVELEDTDINSISPWSSGEKPVLAYRTIPGVFYSIVEHSKVVPSPDRASTCHYQLYPR